MMIGLILHNGLRLDRTLTPIFQSVCKLRKIQRYTKLEKMENRERATKEEAQVDISYEEQVRVVTS